MMQQITCGRLTSHYANLSFVNIILNLNMLWKNLHSSTFFFNLILCGNVFFFLNNPFTVETSFFSNQLYFELNLFKNNPLNFEVARVRKNFPNFEVCQNHTSKKLVIFGPLFYSNNAKRRFCNVITLTLAGYNYE